MYMQLVSVRTTNSMLRHRRTNRVFAAFAAALLALLGAVQSANAQGATVLSGLSFANRTVFGLTDDGWLVRFRAIFPQFQQNVGRVIGLQSPDTSLVGIDFRVQDGKLYGVGNGGGVYTIDTSNAEATLVNTLSVPLQGDLFGVDFNPAADRLRIVSDAGQNLSHNVNPGGTTTNQGTLTYTSPPGTPAPALGITAAAYTNNDLSPDTATTLFDMDSMMDQVVIQSPPGNGILVAAGKLGVDADARAGFDIATGLDNGVAVSNSGFASLFVNGKYGFYSINMLTGQARLIGNLDVNVIDIAVALSQ
jgi:hypothetical protein